MTQKLSKTLKEAIKEAFDLIDREKEGKLDKYGVREVLQLIGQNPTKKEMDEYFKGIEGDKIDREEIGDFIEQFVHLKSQEAINEEIAGAFAKFDTNEDFVITKADFREILTKLGDEPLSNAQADMIIEGLASDSENVKVPDLSKLLSG
ncbi:troponin C, isoallergen Bla g 6.0301-like [Mercenaria mercenaria]|uniref:troponin C, isoallergen Bla g 6.0301-like n=1 Tax=Mercenaria mercenaria TaxID=6596 RepID=UPI001E1DC4B4|nr:troponin C, isoallergen Bla g 6.0301-like [Mercenaria mercenaria]